MTARNVLSLLGYAIAAALFITWFWRARRLTGATSPEGRAADAQLRRQLRWVMVAAFVVLIVTFGMSLLPAV